MSSKLALLLVLSFGCTATYGMRGGSTAPPPPPSSPHDAPSARTPTAGGPAYGPGEDRHWFTADDYLVTTERDEVKETSVAKLVTPPQGDTRNEARFLLFNGKELWTSTFYLSRPAEQADFVIGAPAFCLVVTTFRSHQNAAPRSKQDARTNRWVLAAITDTSELYKGRVSVGRYACPVGAVRVPR